MTKKYLIVSVLSIALLISLNSHLGAEENPPICAENMAETLEQVTSTRRVTFCDGYRDGLTFGLHPSLGYSGDLTNGSLEQILPFINSDTAEADDNFSISLSQLGPSKPGFYEVTFESNDSSRTHMGGIYYYLWSRNFTDRRRLYGEIGSKWGTVKVFRCLSHDGSCITYYDAITCKDYRYPNANPHRKINSERPVVSVKTGSLAHSDEAFKDYESIQNVVDSALESILNISCRD